ncbi:hypothetical protein E8E11_004683 [Didymella keratinophila]|nr:hypothetical protein E8E11_004683 [Didymella keratinophila]
MSRIHLTLGDTGRPEDRVIRIVNLHYEADSKDVRKFFGNGFSVIDFMRGVNAKTKKNTVGYVLLATEQQRIDAQALSGGKILHREVKVLPAQTGLRTSGDKLLPPIKDKHVRAPGVDETHDDSPPAVGDFEAFPSLSMTATPRLTTATLVRTSARKKPAQQLNQKSFRLYFGKYVVVDVKRPLDPRTDTPHPTAFVMFASSEDRDVALHNLKGVPMQGRKVTLEVPKTFQNVDEQGFLPTPNEHAAICSLFPRDPATNAAPPAVPLNSFDARKDLQLAPSFKSFLPANNNNSNDSHHLLGQLQMTDTGGQQRAHHVTSDHTADKRQVQNAKVVWGISRTYMGARHQTQQQTLRPMPSSVEGPGQVVEGSVMTPRRLVSPLARPSSMAPRGPPPGINTVFNPQPYKWAINGNQDPASHVLREDEWHGDQEAIVQRLRESKTQSAEPAVAQCINAEGGIAKDDKKVEETRK